MELDAENVSKIVVFFLKILVALVALRLVLLIMGYEQQVPILDTILYRIYNTLLLVYAKIDYLVAPLFN